jgi:hypothetical protein
MGWISRIYVSVRKIGRYLETRWINHTEIRNSGEYQESDGYQTCRWIPGIQTDIRDVGG